MRRTVSVAAIVWLTLAGAAQAQEQEQHEPGVLRPAGTEQGAPIGRDLGRGLYVLIGAQLNFRVGELTEDLGGGFDFEAANVAGVPDALLGIRYERLTVALGFNWTQVNAPRANYDPCLMQPATTAD